MNADGIRGHEHSGITLLEVIVLLAAMAVLAFVLLPRLLQMRPMGEQAKRIRCVSQLKQIGLSYRQWAYDHHGKFPMSLSMTNGGTMDHPLAHEPWVHYQKLSIELNTPIVLVCPADRRMKEATSFATRFGNSNVSYFVSLEADETRPNMVLSGDRNLTSNNVALSPGLYAVDTNATHGWTKQLHRLNGNIGLADGSVQQSSQVRLQQWLVESPYTNRLAIP